jgi:hypothetical protein
MPENEFVEERHLVVSNKKSEKHKMIKFVWQGCRMQTRIDFNPDPDPAFELNPHLCLIAFFIFV